MTRYGFGQSCAASSFRNLYALSGCKSASDFLMSMQSMNPMARAYDSTVVSYAEVQPLPKVNDISSRTRSRASLG